MSKSLRSYPRSERADRLRWRLQHCRKDQGLGYWGAIDALRNRGKHRENAVEISQQEVKELLAAQG